MRTKNGFDPDEPLPSFLSGHADEHEQRETFELPATSHIFKAGILAIAVMAGGIVIALSLGVPAKVFADARAPQPESSASQSSPNHAEPAIQSDAQAIQPTADAQAVEVTADTKASAPSASEPPTRNEIVVAAQTVSQTQIENRGPDTDALFTEYQAWAAKKNTQAQNGAPTQVVDDAPAPARPAHKHRRLGSVENSQTDTPHLQKSKARVQRQQNAQQSAPAQEQPVQNAQAPSFLQSLSLHQ
jgi:hypothetical protein